MDKPGKILLIQLKRAGDVLLTTPAAAVLKQRWPDVRIDFLVDAPFAPLVENHPAIDRICIYDRKQRLKTMAGLRSERYDWLIDFQSSPRSAQVAFASGAGITAGYKVPFWGRVYSKTLPRPGQDTSVVRGKIALIEHLLGETLSNLAPDLRLTAEEKAWSRKPEASESRRIIGLVPTHRHASRRWHGESFAALAKTLHQAGYAVWLFWGPGERAEVEAVQKQAPDTWMIPATSLRQMAALFSRCELVVSSDNGPMHIAAAVGAPTVTIYGPTDPRAWNPGGPRDIALQAAGLRCLGCNLNTCPFGHECMSGVSPERVFSACQDLLTRSSRALSV
jgi:heptosyltransferase-2